ncbi:MAG: hypothetical protein GX589_10075, partial [Deltaproteobacteria bacterium]|nr:hypothetical protein [Deltaproteobacteria bacterium]
HLMKYLCYHCGTKFELPSGGTVSVRDSCSKCHADLHSCVHCKHYNQSAYNECNETQAERILDKEKANYCDYFTVHTNGRTKGGKSREEHLKQLDDLFKK